MPCKLEALLSCSWGTEGTEDLAQDFIVRTTGIRERFNFNLGQSGTSGQGQGWPHLRATHERVQAGKANSWSANSWGPLGPAVFILVCPRPV